MAVHWTAGAPPSSWSAHSTTTRPRPSWLFGLVEAGKGETVSTSTVLESSDAAWWSRPVGVPAWMDNGDLYGLSPVPNLVAAPGCRPAMSSLPHQASKSGRSRHVRRCAGRPGGGGGLVLVEMQLEHHKMSVVRRHGRWPGQGRDPVTMSWPGPRATVVMEGFGPQPPDQQRRGTCGRCPDVPDGGPQQAARWRCPARAHPAGKSQ